MNFTVNYRNQVGEFIVRDTGVGIASENLQRILNPFERVRNQQVPNVSGTGLGLTIVRLLTDVMGGELMVDSKPGKGSEFKVSLMLSRIETPVVTALQPKPVSGYAGRRLTLLVVDDEAVHRGLIADLLIPLGFIVHEAQSSQECLAIMQDSQPDMVLLDVTMPGENGLLLAKRLRDQGYSMPIVMISADAQERYHKIMEDFAHDDYMVKPINTQVLLEKIAKLLDIRWQYKDDKPDKPSKLVRENTDAEIDQVIDVNHPMIRELKAYADLGYYRGVNECLEKISLQNILTDQQFSQLQKLAAQFRYEMLSQILSGNATG